MSLSRDSPDPGDGQTVALGRYERGDAVPSVEMAKNIADVFEVTLDYLVGEGQLTAFDKQTLQRLFYLIDTVIRDAKTQKAYAS